MSLTINSQFSTALTNLIGADAAKPAPSPFGSFFILALIFVAMYFLLLRPQRKRQKQTSNLQASIKAGDQVVLTSGIYGFVSEVDDEWLWLDVAEKVEIRVAKGYVAHKVSEDAKPTE